MEQHPIVEKVINSLPLWVCTMLKRNPKKLVVAGGVFRAIYENDNIKDIDLFVDSKDTAERLVDDYCIMMGLREVDVQRTKNAINLHIDGEPPIQIITRWMYANPEDVIRSFDFTMAQGSLWWDGERYQSAFGETFFVDVDLRQLVYTSPDRNEDCAGSLMRVVKFLRRGYNIDAKNLTAVVSRLVIKTYQEYDIDSKNNSQEFVMECLHREIAKANGCRY